MNVSETLKKEAIKLRLCDGWTNDWGTPTKEELVDMYIRGLDFCIFNNYPSNDFIKKHFGKIAEDKGVYTDVEIKIINPPIAILNGNTKGEITLSEYSSRDIHVRHNSNIKITVRDYAKAFVHLYDNATVKIVNEGNARSFLYKKGGTATINGNVLVRNFKLNKRIQEWEEIK